MYFFVNTQNICSEVLPSEVHEKELKSGVRYHEIIRYIDDNNSTNVKEGIEEFKGYLDDYLKRNVSKWDSKTTDKRCRDIKHIVEVIIQKIYGTTFGATKNLQLKKSIVNVTNQSLNSYPALECKINSTNDINGPITLRKMLDDYCENTYFIKENKEKILQCPNYKNIISKIEIEKSGVSTFFNIPDTRKNDIFNISETCNLYKFEGMFQSSNFVPPAKIPEVPKVVMTEKPCPNDENQAKPLCECPPEVKCQSTGNECSPWYIFTGVSISLTAILLFFSFLYKYTPIGSWLGNRLRNKKRITNNFHDEDTNELLSYTSEYNQTISPNREYNMPYYSA
ncbi:PIR protein [Plasmodium ovale]|uniref:PIR protein n=1 Tax=Plasmodium ovale TaxID=36330 RepID=A0A1D3KWE8_PLAOA|nr:PIR protein [Plasmodium ovale]